MTLAEMNTPDTNAAGSPGDGPRVQATGPISAAMARTQFVQERREAWERLRSATSTKKRYSADELREIGTLYRSTSGDLAVAGRLFPYDPMLLELELILTPARSIVYARPPGRFSIVEFYRRRYWRLIGERPWLLGAAVALLVIPTIAIFIWALKDPERASTLLGGRFQGGRDSFGDQGYSAAQQSAVASQIFTNNIRVSLLAFAVGITAGLGTAYLLIFNGALLGMVAGLAVHDGHGDVAFALIYGHGFLELTVIAVTAAAGMRMGWALVDPGLRSRGRALREESVVAVEVVLGTMPFFVLAGLIEGFFTPAGFGPWWAGVVGTFFGGAYWWLLWWKGRPAAAPPGKAVTSPLKRRQARNR